MFATCGEVCQLWEETRHAPIKTFKWGVDSFHDVKYNLVQTNLLGKFIQQLPGFYKNLLIIIIINFLIQIY